MARQVISGPITDEMLNKTNYNFLELFNTATKINKTITDLIVEAGDANPEVIQARGGERVLNDRLNSIDNSLEEKPSTEDVGNKITEEINKVPIKEKDIETTPDRYWSTDTNDLIHTLNNETVKVRIVPMVNKKTLVVFGSSTSEGFYATDGNSWYDKLRDTLDDWLVLQRGWSGDSTTRAIGRFHKDVAPYNPDVCVIAFTFGNEGMTKDQTLQQKEEKYSQFKNNILTIAHMCRQIGAVPIIVDQSPTKRYDAEMYRLAAQLNKEMDNLGFMTINFKGAIDSLTASGVPLNLAMHDDLHPNDTGHNAMYKSINPSMFKYLTASTSFPLLESKEGWIATPGDITDTTMPICFTPKSEVDTFTIFFKMRALETVVAQRTWAGFGNESLRISNQNNTNHTLDLRGGGMSEAIISSVGLDDKKEHSVCVSFSGISKTVKFYVDGKLIGSDTSPDLKLTELTLAGRRVDGVIGTNMAYKDLLVYRARLSDDQIYDMHRGFYTRGSLDLYSPMNDIPILNGKLTNLAFTDEYARINTSKLNSY